MQELPEFRPFHQGTGQSNSSGDDPPPVGNYSYSDLCQARDALCRVLGIPTNAIEALSAPQSVWPYNTYRSIGIGPKVAGPYDSRTAGSLAESVVVGVSQKLPRSQLGTNAVPSNIDGIPTDVIPAGRPVGQGATNGSRIHVCLNNSCAYNDTGSLGTLCYQAANPQDLLIMSCAHVLTPTDGYVSTDTVVKSGNATIGTLVSASPLTPFAFHTHDIALARTGPDVVSGGNVNSNGIQSPVLNLTVQKLGPATGPTTGFIRGIHERVDVTYQSRPQTHHFQDVIQVIGASGVFSRAGDSGSLVVTADGNNTPVGILFAGSGNYSYVIPMSTVQSVFGIGGIVGRV